MADITRLKMIACDSIDKEAENLRNIGLQIWNKPELGRQEYHAHEFLTTYLQDSGFQVERKYKLDTAFCATVGNGHPHVAVICEYDALPEIGHACGHNLIAEVGVAAGIGIKAAIEAAGQPTGKLTVLGTPDEEGQGGKINLLNDGAFEDFDVAMMSHPGATNIATPDLIAVTNVTVTYHGKASHAAAFPWEGVNALDAAVMCYQSISCLRQQMKPTWRVHGIITNGGVKPNIIPEKTELNYLIRAPTRKELCVLREKVVDCFECAARGTGCSVEYVFKKTPYLNMVHNMALVSTYKNNALSVGVDFHEVASVSASSDMGNASYVVPSIQPGFYIGSNAFNHTRDFCTASGSEKAQPYAIMQAKALAMTGIDIFMNDGLLQQIKTEFQNEPMRQA